MSKRCRLGLAVTAVLVTALAAGCTSSGSPAKTQAPPSGHAPMTVSSPTPTPTVSPTPTPTPTPTKAPLSAFEGDPAVKAARAWTAEAGRTVNAGSYTSAALRALMTPYLAKQAKTILGSDVGGYYPGPLPFQPLGVTINSAIQRTIPSCVELNGWAQNRTTKRPLHPLQVAGGNFQAVKQSGRWLVSAFYADKKVSCTGVKVATKTW